jgi:hypothetical protein
VRHKVNGFTYVKWISVVAVMLCCVLTLTNKDTRFFSIAETFFVGCVFLASYLEQPKFKPNYTIKKSFLFVSIFVFLCFSVSLVLAII